MTRIEMKMIKPHFRWSLIVCLVRADTSKRNKICMPNLIQLLNLHLNNGSYLGKSGKNGLSGYCWVSRYRVEMNVIFINSYKPKLKFFKFWCPNGNPDFLSRLHVAETCTSTTMLSIRAISH